MFSSLVSNMYVDVNNVNVDDLANNVSEILCQCSRLSRGETAVRSEGMDRIYTDRWDRLLQDRDDSRVWRAIDWKGRYQGDRNVEVCSTDQDFKDFFEGVLDLIAVDHVGDDFDLL